MKKDHIIILSLAAILLVAATAGAAVYLTKENLNTPVDQVVTTTHNKHTTHKNNISWNNSPAAQQQLQPQQVAQTNCDDGNIAGKAVGGVGGGIAGSFIGKGKGKTAATIGGALGGAYLGGEAIPLHNVTCR